MEKRGAAHVEIILSLVLFVSAISLSIYYLNPLDSTKLVDSSLNSVERQISLNTSTRVESYYVQIKNEPTNPIGSVIALNMSGLDSGLEVRVEDLSGSDINYDCDRDGEIVYVMNKTKPWENKEWVVVKFNEEFVSDVITSHPSLNNAVYKISSSDIMELLSEQKILELNRSYYSDYNKLRKEFHIPSVVDFSFEMTFEDGGKISGQREIIKSIEVNSESKRLGVLRKNGGIEFAELNIKTW